MCLLDLTLQRDRFFMEFFVCQALWLGLKIQLKFHFLVPRNQWL